MPLLRRTVVIVMHWHEVGMIDLTLIYSAIIDIDRPILTAERVTPRSCGKYYVLNIILKIILEQLLIKWYRYTSKHFLYFKVPSCPHDSLTWLGGFHLACS